MAKLSLARKAAAAAVCTGGILGILGSPAEAITTGRVCDPQTNKYGCNTATWSWGVDNGGSPIRIPEYAWVGCTQRFTTISGTPGQYQVGSVTNFWRVNNEAWTHYHTTPGIPTWYNNACTGAFQPTTPGGGKYVAWHASLRARSVTFQQCSTCGPVQSYSATNSY